MLNMQRTFSHIFRQGLKGEEKELEYIVITFLFNPYNPHGGKGWPRVGLRGRERERGAEGSCLDG